MNRNERVRSREEELRTAWEAFRSTMWTATPGIIESFNPTTMTCEVQPAIQMMLRDAEGRITMRPLPLLLDCPVIFPSGGGGTLTFPIKPGNECLVVFGARCIDSWWQSGEVQAPAELRMHDLSDGFVIPGPRSQPRVLTGLSPDAVQLRADDGVTFFELDPVRQSIKLVAPGGFEVDAPFIYRQGIEGYGPATSNGKNVDDSHTHGGVIPGSGVSGPVT